MKDHQPVRWMINGWDIFLSASKLAAIEYLNEPIREQRLRETERENDRERGRERDHLQGS